jgi:SPP1 gp7 family putative phage head morphogenesis protein
MAPHVAGRRPTMPVAKAVSATQTSVGQTPAAIEDALQAQGMGSTTDMGPGRPINPASSYSGRPRAMDYQAGANSNTGRSRTAWGRTSFDTLRGIIDAYDVARMCINHKIDELLSMEPLFLPAEGVKGDVEVAIAAARAALESPDRELAYDAWLSKWMEDVFRYDAGTLYRRRNLAGEVIGLEIVDGTTIVPDIDEHGRRPQPPAPAYWQAIQGMPWTWLTTDDIVQTIRRPQPNSPFGLAPMESVLLTANTDLRFQQHFLEMFTEGNVPAGFVELPGAISTPDQVAEWQDYWDALMLGDQAMLRRLRAVPMGTKVTETRPKTFEEAFPQYLMARTASAFGVVPQDLGLVQDVNRANGETQVDVQFRVNTLPWVRFVERVLSRYLRRDLGLPVQVKLDTGRDKEDRLAEAQAWQIYIDSGMASVDEGRQELLGLPIDNERPVPRFYASPRTGPVPLRSIFAISGPIDGETGAPVDTVPLDTTPFDGAPGVLPDKSPGGTQFKRAPINADDPSHPENQGEVPGSDVLGTTPSTKPLIDSTAEGAAVEAQQAAADPLKQPVTKDATVGITTETGIEGVDLLGDDEDEDGIDPTSGDGSLARHELAKAAELASFQRFTKAAGKAGRWRRDFTFTATDPTIAHRLNQAGRARVRKAAGQLVAAGLAVVAADTGRVLMLQRAMDDTDPAAGYWELPGGCIEPGEDPNNAARREWSEETGLDTPYADGGDPTPDWTSANGIYAGYVQVVLAEADVPIFDRADGMNPDDPDGDGIEALAWWDPAQLVGNPAVRPELAADLDTVLPLLEAIGPKAGSPVAKSWRDGAARTPQHEVDLRLVDFYAPKIGDALAQLITPGQLRAAIEAVATTVTKDADPAKARIVQAVVSRLTGQADASALEQIVRQVIADGYLAGGAAARRQIGSGSVTLDGATGQAIADINWDVWEPGDVDAAIRAADGGLATLLDQAGVGIKGVVGSTLDDVGNAIADGVLSGLSVDDIAASMSDWATGFRAERIAQTESARAVTAATLDTYQVNGIGEWTLVLSDGACDLCEEVADGGPYPATDSEDAPPVHPMCRCAASPVTGGTSGSEEAPS